MEAGIKFGNLKIQQRANIERVDKLKMLRDKKAVIQDDIDQYYRKARKSVTDRNCIALVDLESMSVVVYDDHNIDYAIFKKTKIKTKENLDQTIEYVKKEYKQCKVTIKPVM